jgi:hypothetical protein
MKVCKEAQLHSISTIHPMMVWPKGCSSSPPIKGGHPSSFHNTILGFHNTTQESHNVTRREVLYSYLSSLASSSIGSEWVRVEKYRSCWLPPLVYLGPLVHLAEGMPGIVGSSPFVLVWFEYYLEYKVHVYLWWWVLLWVSLVHYLLVGSSSALVADTLVMGPDKDG